MLNALIRFSLQHRLLVLAASLVIVGYGGWSTFQLPIDVFPDLNRPRVTIMTEALGRSPEEVETLITFPLESTLNGATGVQAVRSQSGVGLSVVNVEFDWTTDIYIARQVVAEKLAMVRASLPDDVQPQMAPISSIMGQIMLVGMWSEGDKTRPIEVRTLADWVVRQRLLTIPGVAQVITIGGGRKQYQVIVDPHRLLEFGVTLEEVEKALAKSNANATGGYLDQGTDELLVRSLGRIQDPSELDDVVVKDTVSPPILLRQVARAAEAPQVKRGDAAVDGQPAVILVINKQPGADTRLLTERVAQALEELKPSLPKDIRLNPEVYQQRSFIDRAIYNVIEALVLGGVLVVVILFIFLMNFRTTFITLTAIPLSLVVTTLVFQWFGMSINIMTLGGLAVAIGELVDDAIVDVENIFRRLRENEHAAQPLHPLLVVFRASTEVRSSIVFSTMIICLVFVPLLALSGMEGRLFTPLGVAYIVSILASLVVSLTVTPVLSYLLLPKAKATHRGEGWLLRALKWLAGYVIRFGTRHPWPVFGAIAALVAVGMVLFLTRGRDFLPPFNEGVVQVNVLLPPGTSLATSDHIADLVDERLMKIPDVAFVGRRTGRAELDEHAEGVNVSELIVSFKKDSHRHREEIVQDVRGELEELKRATGIVTGVEQPLAHLITHMLSGVKAQVGIKVFGDDLAVLRQTASEIQSAVNGTPGVKDLQVEQQVEVPQLQIQLDRGQLAYYGLHVQDVNDFVETAMNGKTVSTILLGQRSFDLVVRLDEPYRQDPETLGRLAINLPTGGQIPLGAVAAIERATGPNTIQRENVRRRIVIQCNTADRALGDVVNDIRARVAPIQARLPTGYFIEYGGQFQAQEEATRLIGFLSILSLAGMFLVLYTLLRSVNLTLQVLVCLPAAFVGGVAALVLTGQSLTVASLVGFISLGGIASRNGILLMTHYLHLLKYEGETFGPAMIERAGKERLAPVLMTAFTAGIALVPLVLAAGEPGKEILYPVATVILGGLISSTALEFLARPALFAAFGRRAAERVVGQGELHVDLVEEDAPLRQPAHAA